MNSRARFLLWLKCHLHSYTPPSNLVKSIFNYLILIWLFEKTPSLLYGKPIQQSSFNLNMEGFFRKFIFSINIMFCTICE